MPAKPAAAANSQPKKQNNEGLKERGKVSLKLNTNFDLEKYEDKSRIPDAGASEKKIVRIGEVVDIEASKGDV